MNSAHQRKCARRQRQRRDEANRRAASAAQASAAADVETDLVWIRCLASLHRCAEQRADRGDGFPVSGHGG
jgi:hypothetical protein